MGPSFPTCRAKSKNLFYFSWPSGRPVARRPAATVPLRPMLSELLDGWRRDLAGWAIPEEITGAVPESPWVLPRQGFARRADRVAPSPVGFAAVLGAWPDMAPQVGPADVVTCHNVLYNVPGLAPFVAALTAAARRIVVAQMTAEHPLVALNALWLRFHGLRRPVGPTAADLLRILDAMGLRPGHETWGRPCARV